MQTIITRHGWCEECYKQHRPHSEDLYLAFGTTSNDWIIKWAQGNGLRGFVPVNYRIHKAIGQTIIFDYACSFCDIEEVKTPGGVDLFVLWHKRSNMSITDWNAMVVYKRDPSYLI